MDTDRKANIERYRSKLRPEQNQSEGVLVGILNSEVSLALVEAIEGLQKQIPESAKALINSNENVAASSDKHARVMQRLTWALVFVGAMQAVATVATVLLTIYSSK